MRRIINVVIYFITKIIQIALMIGMYILQKLTHKSAGVNHHLYYKNVQYRARYFTDMNVLILKIILVMLVIYFLILLIKYIKKSNKLIKTETIFIILWSMLIISTLQFEIFNKLLVYSYLVLAELISLSFEIIIYSVNKNINKMRKMQ